MRHNHLLNPGSTLTALGEVVAGLRAGADAHIGAGADTVTLGPRGRLLLAQLLTASPAQVHAATLALTSPASSAPSTVTIAEAAVLLGVPESTVLNWCAEGVLTRVGTGSVLCLLGFQVRELRRRRHLAVANRLDP